jgi:glyoxylase-like metal-dependent hydrolase (beta-lactamase superfamily II)
LLVLSYCRLESFTIAGTHFLKEHMLKLLWLPPLLFVPSLVFAQLSEIKVTRVSGNIYTFEGAGGNIAASVGEDGILLVDDQVAAQAGQVQAALKQIDTTGRRVVFVVNTHFHSDHAGGNAAFRMSGAVIVAQEQTLERLRTGGKNGISPSLALRQPAVPKEGEPTITFDDQITFHFNGEEVRVWHVPAAHTDGDAMVYFTKSNVLHTGDVFVRYGFPGVDLISGGSVQGMISALENVGAQLPADLKVIPGHGASSTLENVRDFVTMLKEISMAVEKALAEHKTVDQMKQERLLAPWQKWSGPLINTDLFIETLYNSLTTKK